MMKRSILLGLVLLVTASSFAVEAEVNGLWYEFISKTQEAKVIQYKDNINYTGNIVVPEVVEYDGVNYNVTSIGTKAFFGCSNLTSVTIPNSVLSLGRETFRDCSSLTSITIPNKVVSLEYGVFCGTGLTSVVIPNSVTNIEQGAFAGCLNMTSVTIPNSVTSIGVYAFNDCYSLTSVHISDLESWCKIVFYGDLANPLYYAHHLYLNDEEIINLVIPDGVTSIGEGAFRECSNLATVTIANSVTNIGNEAFYRCNGLTTVTIPNNVSSIGGGAFKDCVGLTSVVIGNNVVSIGENAFYGCVGLTEITIPNSVTSIRDRAFYKCSGVTTISIGSSVNTIKQNVFAFCPEVKDVYCYAESVPSTSSDVFEGSYVEYATLHVPTNSINVYKTASPWNSFNTVVGVDGTVSDTQKCATPTIVYTNGKLSFDCETKDVDFISEITDSDIKMNYTSEIDLTVTYNISVYATKAGYDNSDVATATLCWIDVEPKTEGVSNNVANVRAIAVMIQSDDGQLTVNGAGDGTQICVYSIDGVKVGSGISCNGSVVVKTSLPKNSVALVKIGDKSYKVVMK